MLLTSNFLSIPPLKCKVKLPRLSCTSLTITLMESCNLLTHQQRG